MANHPLFRYKEMFRILIAMAKTPPLVPLLDTLDGIFKSTLDLVEGLTSVGEDLKDIVDEGEEAAEAGGGKVAERSQDEVAEAKMAGQLHALIMLVVEAVPKAVTDMHAANAAKVRRE